VYSTRYSSQVLIKREFSRQLSETPQIPDFTAIQFSLFHRAF